MALGSIVENTEMLNVLTNLLLFVLITAAPVFIPWEALPLPLRLLGYLLPPSYAADALRRARAGAIGPAFYFDLAMLLALTVASLYALSRWLRWRLA